MKSHFAEFVVVVSIALAFAASVTGCKKDNNLVDNSSVTVSEDDAADVIAASLGGNGSTQGFAAGVAEAAAVALGNTISSTESAGKASSTEDTVTIVRQKSGAYSYNYTFRFSWNLVPNTSLVFGYSMKGTYDTPRLASDDSANASWVITGLGASPEFILNGSYLRLGSEELKVRNQASLTTRLSINAVNVTIDKTTGEITGGTGTSTLTGTTSGGRSFAFTGTLTFSGSQSAILMINGKRFTLNLTLGEATAG
jgi:hypothetical protein